MYKRLHPKASKVLNFGSTTRQVIRVMNDVVISRYSPFGRHLTRCGSIHLFFIYIAQLPHFSSSSSFSAISMTYHTRYSKSRQSTPGLRSELGSWIHERLQHDDRVSSWFALCSDRSIFDSYDSTDLSFVGEFRL